MQRNFALPLARPASRPFAATQPPSSSTSPPPHRPFESHRHPKPYPSSPLTRVWSTGMNRLGQLGTGEPPHQNSYFPTPIRGLDGKEIVLAAAGTSHALAFTSKGELYAWGAGKHMQLGTKAARDEFKPVLVPDAAQYFGKDAPIQALGNGVTSAVLTESGTVFIWGKSERIDSVTADVAPYRPLQGRDPIASIGVGWGHYLACTRSGELLSWGWNQHGQLGDGTTEHHKLPKPVTSIKDRVVQVAAGQDHSVAVTEAGEVYVWGSCQHGQLGLEREVESVPLPRKLPLPEKIAQAACGMSHTLLLSRSGNVYSFGWNTSGQTGHMNGSASVLVPTELDSLEGTVVRVAAGRLQSAAITEQHHAWVWGHCLALGLGGGEIQPVPECLEEFEQPHLNILDVACGYDFSLFVTHDLPRA